MGNKRSGIKKALLAVIESYNSRSACKIAICDGTGEAALDHICRLSDSRGMLLSHGDSYYEVIANYYSDEHCPEELRLTLPFHQPPFLPIEENAKLYNILHACESGVQLDTYRADASDNSPIVLVSVSAFVSMDGLSERTLGYALGNLKITAKLIQAIMENRSDGFHDHWAEDAAFTDEEDDPADWWK